MGSGLDASWSEILVAAAIVMVISYTLTKERIFAPLRHRLGGRETALGYLASCPFCASWWVSFVVVPLTRTWAYRLPPDASVVTQVVNWFFSCALVVAVAAFLRVAFFFVDESQGLVRRRQKEVEVQRAVLERQLPRHDHGRHPLQ